MRRRKEERLELLGRAHVQRVANVAAGKLVVKAAVDNAHAVIQVVALALEHGGQRGGRDGVLV